VGYAFEIVCFSFLFRIAFLHYGSVLRERVKKLWVYALLVEGV